MEETRLFIKGEHSDFSEQNQPEHTYRNAVNWIRNLDGSLTTEKGTSIFCNDFPDKDIIGTLVLENDVVFFLYDDGGEHEIGWITVTDDVSTTNYTSKIISPALEFSRDNLIKSRGRIDYRRHRLVYFVDGINSNRIIDLDREYSLSTFKSDIKLQLDSVLPDIDYVSQTTDGELPTGIYQFQARLLTSSGNKTSVGFPTTVIPVIDDIGGMSDGALPQSPSSKSINLSISNIDSKYKFIEIIAVTYEGTANIMKVYVIGRRQITGPTMTFKYASTSQNIEEISADEVTIEPIVYESGKLIEYKDGHLLIAGLTGRKEGSGFQAVANAITVRYKITEIPYVESITHKGSSSREDFIIPESSFGGKQGYAIEDSTVNLKGFRREEVYSLSISPVYKDGTTGFAYHIPAPIRHDGVGSHRPAIKSSINEGFCGTYFSEAKYPTGFGYPSPFNDGKVRHHLMPTLEQEPIYVNNNIRVLGLSLSNIDLTLLDEQDRENIIGYTIGYQRRTNVNKSILTQGIAQPLIRNPRNDEAFVSPFHGKGAFNYPDNIAWLASVTITNPDDRTWNYYEDAIAFYSPETIITGESMISADYIDRVSIGKGKGYVVASERSGGRREEYMHAFMDFTTYTNPKFDAAYPNTTPIHKDTIQYIPSESASGKFSPSNFKVSGKTISTKKCNGYLFFHTDGRLPLYTNRITKDTRDRVPEIAYELKQNKVSDFKLNRGGVNNPADQGGLNYAEVSRSIYNLRAVRSTQYGEISDAEYVYLAHGTEPSIDIFNGDTFISKVGIVSTTAEPHIDGGTELKFYTLNYVMLESSINTNYRHYINTGGEEKGTVPYFPKQRTIWSKDGQNGLLQVNPTHGHATGYNRQYSFDSGIKKYFPKPLLLEEEVTRFDNRVIYSEVSMEGEQFDANRLYLPNNYHDVPKHKGSISDMFVHSNTLYFHTPQTLFRAFFNESTTQLSSSGEVMLGNGGLFPRPCTEMYTIAGGYAGTSSPSGVNTPYGRIFIDEIQGKVFLLGESISEISMEGWAKWFRANLSVEPDTLTEGYVATFDYTHRRYLLSRKGRSLIAQYASRYKGIWSTDREFVSSLTHGDIVYKDGRYVMITTINS